MKDTLKKWLIAMSTAGMDVTNDSFHYRSKVIVYNHLVISSLFLYFIYLLLYAFNIVTYSIYTPLVSTTQELAYIRALTINTGFFVLFFFAFGLVFFYKYKNLEVSSYITDVASFIFYIVPCYVVPGPTLSLCASIIWPFVVIIIHGYKTGAIISLVFVVAAYGGLSLNSPGQTVFTFYFLFMIFFIGVVCVIEQMFTKSHDLLQEARDKERHSANKTIELKSSLLAAASHDLRQPLHTMAYLIEELKEYKDSISNPRIIEDIEKSNNYLSRLLDSILNIAKIEEDMIDVNKKNISIELLFSDLYREYSAVADAKNISLSTFPIDEWVYTDYQHIYRMLSNIIANAIKYTEKGTVVLSCRKGRSQQVEIEIKDTGVGISDEEMPFIFNLFTRAGADEKSADGLGLGLYIVKKLAELLSVDISVTSVANEGTVFRLTLPLGVPLPDTEIAERVEQEFEMPGGMLVLIIDDDPDILFSLEQTLNRWGCAVITAQTIKEALMKAYDEEVHVILSDLVLSQKENGVDAINKVCGLLGRDIPAMIITAETDTNHLQAVHDKGYKILHKPLLPKTLKDELMKINFSML